MNTDMRPWNVLILLSVMVMAAFAAVDFFLPRPTLAQSIQRYRRAEKDLREKSAKLREDLAEIDRRIEQRTWKGTPDSVGAQALDIADGIAKAHQMSMSAFRPQKAMDDGELTRLSFVMTLEGRFVGLQQVVRELETPARRLSVHLVQVASADEASDLVNATVGITAFLEKPKPKPETKDKKT